MAIKKAKAEATRRKQKARPKSPATKARSKGFTSGAWERVYLMSVELDAFAEDLGLSSKNVETEGFSVLDTSRELNRRALNYNQEINRDGRTPEQEKEDWVGVAGIGADLGNLAEEQGDGETIEGVRAIAHELCYLACDFLF